MYHEIAQPYAFLYNLAPALKPGARVGIGEVAEMPSTEFHAPPEPGPTPAAPPPSPPAAPKDRSRKTDDGWTLDA